MDGSPLFSVIIVNYNGGDYLQKAVDSLNAQTFRDFEVWIVDNDSSDSSMELLDISALDNAQVIMAGENLGFAEGNNIAARRANGEWLVLLNCDAIADPDWLQAIKDGISRHKSVSMFASLQYRLEEEGLLDGTGDGYTAFGYPWRGGYLWPVSEIPPEGFCFSPCGASAVYRADKFREHKGFDKRYFCFVEDIDLAFRMRLAGEECVLLPDAVVHHKGSALSGQNSEFTVVNGHRNLVWTYLGNMPTVLLALTLPVHLLLTVYILIAHVGKKRGGYIWRGTKEGWKTGWQIRRQRRTLRNARKARLMKLAKAMTWNPFNMSRHVPDVRPLKRK